EPDPLAREDVHDRPKPLGEVRIALFQLGEVVWWKGVEPAPDARTGESVDAVDTEPRGRPCRIRQPLGRPTAHSLRLPAAPDLRRKDRTVAVIDRVADALTDQMVGDRKAPEAVPVEDLPPALDVGSVGDRPVDFEVITPASQLQAVEAPGARPGSKLLESEV